MNARTGMSPDLPPAAAASAISGLERPFPVTLFRDRVAATKHEERLTLRSLAERVQTVTAASKPLLPWLKLARFGELRSDKDSLRHDANVLAISGIEGDYDGAQVPFDEAVERLEKAGVLAMVYTSPSHAEGAPRWRALCPTSAELTPQVRTKLVGRLNGLLRGILSSESWTLSQAYYFGRVNSNPCHRVELVDGTPIDLLHDLDEIWCGKPRAASAIGAPGVAPRPAAMDEAALLADIVAGRSYHPACMRLVGKWARDGVCQVEARARVLAAMEAVPGSDRDGRWWARYTDVDRCVGDIYAKEAKARDDGRRPAQCAGTCGTSARPASDDESWPEPVDFLADDALTGAPALLPEHLPDALYPFVADTAGRMGVDPASVALCTVVSCASVADDKWRLQPKRHDDGWTESPRLWGAIVGAPSILKTPVIRACTAPLDRLDAEARERNAADVRKHEADMAVWKAAGEDPSTRPLRARLDRYVVEGTTTEALSEILRDDHEAKQRAPAGKVLSRQDEMSEWVAGFDRYRAGGRGGGDRGAYLRLYNGGRHTVDRVGRGSIAIPNWSACVLGGIQPEPIRRIAGEAADDGLLQRFCYCVPTRQGRGEDRSPDRAALRRYDALFPALAALHPPSPALADEPLSGGGGRTRPVVLHAGAHRHRLEIDELAAVISGMPDTSNRLKAALGKWPGLFARIALTFHLVELADANARGVETLPPMVLPEATARRAAGYLRDVLLPHLLRAEALMFSTTQTGHARWIAGFILAKRLPRITARDVVQAYHPLRVPDRRRELEEVMESLVTVGWLRPEPQSNHARLPTAWAVNPAVHSVFAERGSLERKARGEARASIAEAVARIRGERR